MSTMDGRYQVCDEICGLVDSVPTKYKAITEATYHHRRHQTEGDAVDVEIFDLLARWGAPQYFVHDGRVIRWRKRN